MTNIILKMGSYIIHSQGFQNNCQNCLSFFLSLNFFDLSHGVLKPINLILKMIFQLKI